MSVLLVAAHGTRSEQGLATTRAFLSAVRTARPSLRVELCFLDVLSPSLAEALAALCGEKVVVVPLLLSAGYHVQTDIPAVVADRRGVRVARHLGPDPLLIEALADRLRESDGTGRTLLAAIASSRPSAREEVTVTARLLAERLDEPIEVLPLDADLRSRLEGIAGPIRIGPYLLAEGGFLHSLRTAADGIGTVAEPIGVHSALVRLTLSRFDEVAVD